MPVASRWKIFALAPFAARLDDIPAGQQASRHSSVLQFAAVNVAIGPRLHDGLGEFAQDIAHGRETVEKLNTDQMRRDSIFIEQLRADVALLREALIGLEDATSHIPGHHGPDVWRVVESARQALEKTKP